MKPGACEGANHSPPPKKQKNDGGIGAKQQIPGPTNRFHSLSHVPIYKRKLSIREQVEIPIIACPAVPWSPPETPLKAENRSKSRDHKAGPDLVFPTVCAGRDDDQGTIREDLMHGPSAGCLKERSPRPDLQRFAMLPVSYLDVELCFAFRHCKAAPLLSAITASISPPCLSQP